MKRNYQEGEIPFSHLPFFVAQVMAELRNFNMRGIYESCGYGVAGMFDSRKAFPKAVDVTCRFGLADSAGGIVDDILTESLGISKSHLRLAATKKNDFLFTLWSEKG